MAVSIRFERMHRLLVGQTKFRVSRVMTTSLTYLIWRRVWDSNPCAGYQPTSRLAGGTCMTTQVTLRILFINGGGGEARTRTCLHRHDRFSRPDRYQFLVTPPNILSRKQDLNLRIAVLQTVPLDQALALRHIFYGASCRT